MRTKERKKTERLVKKLKKVLKILEILVKIGILILCLYVFIDRLQDINGIDFFFTTWR